MSSSSEGPPPPPDATVAAAAARHFMWRNAYEGPDRPFEGSEWDYVVEMATAMLDAACRLDGPDRLALGRELDEANAHIAQLEEALRPFAAIADRLDDRRGLVGPSPLYAVHDECVAARAALRGADVRGRRGS